MLFIGSGVRLVADTTVAGLLEQIALDHNVGRFEGLPIERRGREALRHFAGEVPDHTERCRLLRERLESVRPAEGYMRLASLIKDGYFPAIYTMGPDDMLETALSTQHLERDKDYHLLVAGVDPPSSFTMDLRESTRVAIIKCGGDLNSKFLPLTEDEIAATVRSIRDVIADSFKVLSIFAAYVNRDKPFIECVPRDGAKAFWVNSIVPMKDRELYEELKLESPASIQYHQLQPEVTDLLEARHSARHLLAREPGTFNEFMANLHNRLYRQRDRDHRRRRRDLTVLRGGPYRFLDYFDVTDAQFFFGREDDVEALLTMIEDHPLVVLFGRSGIGKTSLLRAGVMVELGRKAKEVEQDQRPWLPVYALCEDDPLDSIREAAVEAAEEAGFNAESARGQVALSELLQSIAETTGHRVLVILDQFEEFFVKLGTLVKERFVDEITGCLDTSDGQMSILLSIREDFVGELYELQDHLPTIMQQMYRLRKLTREQAESAIVKPAMNFGIRVEPDLVERMVEDLSREGVEPTQLQIVCDRLYESLTPGSHVITERHYDRLGGTQRILSQYLNYALGQFPLPERRVARTILKHMATSSELKAARPLERIAAELAMDEESVERVLARMVDFRLLRGVDKDRKRNYELVHEYLAEDIGGWLSDDELKLKDVQDLLTRELNNYEKFGLLMDAETLRIVGEQRQHLSISPAALEMIIPSAAASQTDVRQWMSRLPELGRARGRLLSQMMTDSNPRVRQTAYNYLPEPANPVLMPQLVAGLRDSSSAIQQKARRLLRGMERELIAALKGAGPVEKADAAFALGKIAPRRHIPHLLDALEDGQQQCRDVVTEVLSEVTDKQIGREVLDRLIRQGERAPWTLAYLMGHLVDSHELLDQLERLAIAAPSARLEYALGLALSEWRQFDRAEQALNRALQGADEYGAELIGQALEQIATRRKRASSGGDRWEMFRRTATHTGATPQALPPPLKKAWGYRTDGTLMGSAVVSDSVVYFGSRDGTLYALASARGSLLWTLKTGDRIEATPAVGEGLVFVGSYDRRLYAVDANSGARRWTQTLKSETRSSCTVADGRVWIGCRSGTVYCFDAQSGEKQWEHQMAEEVSGAPVVADGSVIVGSWDSNICAVHATTGSLIWQVATDGPVSCSAAVADEVVYCGSDDYCLYAIDLNAGSVNWCAELGTQVRSSPAIAGDRLVVGGINGGIFCVSRENGQVIWRADAEEEVLSSPAIAADVVYVGSKDGSLYALALEDGEILWSYPTAYGIYSSPTIAEETLYIGLEHNELVAFRPTDE